MRKIQCKDILLHVDKQDFYFVKDIGIDPERGWKYYNVRCVYKSPLHDCGKLKRIFEFEIKRKDIVLSNLEELTRTKTAIQVLYGKSGS